MGFGLLTTPPHPADRFVVTLVVLQNALFAYLLGWLVDRLLELARRQMYRVALTRIAS